MKYKLIIIVLMISLGIIYDQVWADYCSISPIYCTSSQDRRQCIGGSLDGSDCANKDADYCVVGTPPGYCGLVTGGNPTIISCDDPDHCGDMCTYRGMYPTSGSTCGERVSGVEPPPTDPPPPPGPECSGECCTACDGSGPTGEGGCDSYTCCYGCYEPPDDPKYPPMGQARIFVFHDVNKNGIFDSGDESLPDEVLNAGSVSVKPNFFMSGTTTLNLSSSQTGRLPNNNWGAVAKIIPCGGTWGEFTSVDGACFHDPCPFSNRDDGVFRCFGTCKDLKEEGTCNGSWSKENTATGLYESTDSLFFRETLFWDYYDGSKLNHLQTNQITIGETGSYVYYQVPTTFSVDLPENWGTTVFRWSGAHSSDTEIESYTYRDGRDYLNAKMRCLSCEGEKYQNRTVYVVIGVAEDIKPRIAGYGAYDTEGNDISGQIANTEDGIVRFEGSYYHAGGSESEANTLENHSFEDDDLKWWVWGGWQGSSGIDTTTKYTGERSVKITAEQGTYGSYMMSQSGTDYMLDKSQWDGKTLHVSFYYMLEDSNASVYAKVNPISATAKNGGIGALPKVNSPVGSWARYEESIVIPDTIYSNVTSSNEEVTKFDFDVGVATNDGNPATAWIDDVVISENPNEIPVNIKRFELALEAEDNDNYADYKDSWPVRMVFERVAGYGKDYNSYRTGSGNDLTGFKAVEYDEVENKWFLPSNLEYKYDGTYLSANSNGEIIATLLSGKDNTYFTSKFGLIEAVWTVKFEPRFMLESNNTYNASMYVRDFDGDMDQTTPTLFRVDSSYYSRKGSLDLNPGCVPPDDPSLTLPDPVIHESFPITSSNISGVNPMNNNNICAGGTGVVHDDEYHMRFLDKANIGLPGYPDSFYIYKYFDGSLNTYSDNGDTLNLIWTGAGGWNILNSIGINNYEDQFEMAARVCNGEVSLANNGFGENNVCSGWVINQLEIQARPWFAVDGGIVGVEGDSGMIDQTVSSVGKFFQGNPSGMIINGYTMANNKLGNNYFISNTNVEGIKYDYEYWEKKLSDYITNDDIPHLGWIDNEGEEVGIYIKNGDYSTTGDVEYEFGSNGEKHAIMFIDGDFTLTKNIVMANNSSLMMIIKGNMEVAEGVDTIEGIYVIDEEDNEGDKAVFRTRGSGSSSTLIINGNVIAYGGVDLLRDLGTGNIEPAEKFVYDSDLISRLYAAFGNKITTFKYNWKEAVPGN